MTGLYIFLLIACGFAAVILYAYLSNRRAQNRQKKMVRAFREHPVISKNAPILLHGPAQSPDLILPTTGEHVAYYALIILSKESSLSEMRYHAHMGGSTLSTSHVTGIQGFRFFVTSGDFAVNSGGIPYTIQISSLMNWFAKGFSMVSSLVGDIVTSSGIPAGTFDDTISLEVAEQALLWAFGYSAPIKSTKNTTGGLAGQTTYASSFVDSVKSTVDTRVQNYMTGVNLPPGILSILQRKGITPEDKMEITVIELFIPLNKEVWVFGTFDGDRSVIYADPVVRLMVSYDDPELI